MVLADSALLAWYAPDSITGGNGNGNPLHWASKVTGSSNQATFGGTPTKATDNANAAGNTCIVSYMTGTAAVGASNDIVDFPEVYSNYTSGFSVCTVTRHLATQQFRFFGAKSGDYVCVGSLRVALPQCR